MRRPPLPGFVAEVVDDRPAFRTLVTAALALVAAGLDPHVVSPGLPSVQAALRAQPELEALAALVGVAGATTLLVGGVAADGLRTRRLVEGGLAALAITAAACLVVTDGTLFVAARFAGAAAAGLIIPFAVAVVAISYQGVARATAIGFAYAAYGGAMAASPILLTLTGAGGTDAAAYLVTAVAAIGALVAARRGMRDLPGASRVDLPVVARIAIWAFGIIALAAGIAAVGSGAHPIRLAMIALGLAALGVALVLERRARRDPATLEVDLRPVSVVLAAGLFVGFAQAVPMALLPVFFQIVLGFGPLAASASIAPLIVALVIAGPIAGWLLPRFSPRSLIGGGLIAVGAGDLVLGVVAGQGVSYLLFVLPFVLVGAGFVIATTVRTAVIFASVPRGLPASAAALNEASVGLGSRLGIAVAAVVMTEVALASYASTLPPGTDTAAALAPFHDLLVALGTPSFTSLVAGIDATTGQSYGAAYVDGIRVVHLVTGALAVAAGAGAIVALGRRDPLRSVWDHRDERGEPVGDSPARATGDPTGGRG
jgi:DHA2 family multidrug resistance protein-like MFS transporter